MTDTSGQGTFTGYVPRFEMPIVPRAPDGTSSATQAFYQQLQVTIGLALSGPGGAFLDIMLAQAANASSSPNPTLFAMAGGFVRFYPAGAGVPSPDGFSDPAQGVLMLTPWLGDVEAQKRAFPPDTPRPGAIYYVGVDEAATKLILRDETARMSEAALRASWTEVKGAAPPPGTSPSDLIDAHNDRVMAGTGSVFVDGGTPIGKAVQDVSAAVETYRFTLRMTNLGPPIVYVSPLPAIRGAPYHAF